jgi:Response regulator containing a CheY-like receiver domain and an HTH DNA-binding domain
MIRLLIVDDHDVVRMGLKQVFSGRVDMEVAGEARTGEEAIAQVRANPFDVALVDLSLSDMSGVDVLNRSKAIRPEMAVLIVSGYPGGPVRDQPAQGGRLGFVAKDAPSENLSRRWSPPRRAAAT